jgi:kynurenine formamidase
MCDGHVAKVVRERIQREGLPSVSRRNFLRFGGMAAAAAAVSRFTGSVAKAQDTAMPEVVDLSHIFRINPPTYVPTDVPSRSTLVTVEENGFYIQQWTFGEHTGTHVDIPAHFVADGETVDIYSPQLLVSPAVVIDIAAKAEENPDAELTVDDIMAWESENGEIPAGALVCMYSGWESRYESVEEFRNADADGVMHFPGFSGDAAAFLVTERDIHGIAVDTLSLDNGTSTTFDTHYTILGAGKYGIENVANLAQLIGKPAQVVVGVPRWEAGSGGPCRVLALT